MAALSLPVVRSSYFSEVSSCVGLRENESCLGFFDFVHIARAIFDYRGRFLEIFESRLSCQG